jgi:hypothetical protein
MFAKRTLIQRCESDDVVGEYGINQWSGGQLEMKNGARFLFKPSALGWPVEWRTPDGASPLVTFTNKGFFRNYALVKVHTRASSQAELMLLVLLGFYLVGGKQRAAAIAAAS